MADATPQTTGRVTRRSTRLASMTPQVQCVGTGNPVAKTKAGATANKTPRGALFDISNDVSNSSEATKFSTPEPLKQCKTPKKEEEATQPLSLQSAMHDAAEEDVEHNDNGTPQDETSAELKEELPVEVVHEEEEEEAPVEAPEEVPAAEEVAPEAPEEMALAVEEAVHEAPEVVHEAPEEAEAAEVPAAKVLSRDAQARHLLGEVMAKIMPLDTRTEGLEDLYRFTKAFPNYDINKYMAKTKESFRQFIKTSIEEIAMREAEKELQEDMPIAAEEEQSAVETEELIDEPMETAEEEELNEEVEQIEEEELKEAVEQIEEEELNEEVEQIEEGEIGMIEDSHEAEEIAFSVAAEEGTEYEEGPAAEATLPSPEMPRAPPATPNPFYEAEDEEILVDFAPTPMVSPPSSRMTPEAREPVMDCGAEAEVTPAPAEAAVSSNPLVPQSEAGSDGGFRWLMMSPTDGSTPSQWASNFPMEGSPAPGEELVELQLPGEEALPHHALKSTVVVPEDFDPRSLRELRKEIAGRTKEEKQEEVAVEPKAVKKQKKPKGAKKQQQQVVVKELEEEKEDDMVTNMSTDLLAARIRSEHPRHWRFGGEEEEELEAVEWEDADEEGDECQEADGLAEMLGDMAIEQGGPLRGLPAAQGKHIRFDDDGSAAVSPSSRRVPLKGLPQATGNHVFFD